MLLMHNEKYAVEIAHNVGAKKRKEIVLSDTEAYTSDDDEGHTIVDYGTDNYDSESSSPPSSPTSQTNVLLLP